MGEQVTNIGIVGTGVISGTYLDHLAKLPGVDVVAVADLDLSRAQAIADQHQGIRALSSEDLLADPEVDIVLNLTIPAAHASVNQAALQAGKHVYGEKPLAVDRAEAEPLLKLAAMRQPSNRLRSGHCARHGDPDRTSRPRPGRHRRTDCCDGFVRDARARAVAPGA